MDFELSHDQRLLHDSAGAFARRESPPARMRRMRDDPRGWSPALWKQMGELGWLAVMLPDELGGTGGSFVDAALLLEQFGTTLVPEPFVPSVVLAGTALLRAGTAEQHARWLPALASGDASGALAYAERTTRYDASAVATRAERTPTGYKLSGEKTWVLNGHAADVLLVSARTGGGARERAGVSLFVVERDAPGVRIEPVAMMDGHRAAIVTLAGVALDADRRLGPEGGAADLLDELLDLGAAAACAEGVGLMRALLAMTCEYLGVREQFGAKIGTFQALQHRAVDMFVETELARSVSLLASIKVGEPDAAERTAAISAARVQFVESGRFVARQAIQLHGGIGITDEHDAGLYFKRLQVLTTFYGDDEHHVRRFASLPGFTAGLTAG